jgi:hypothetical protein
MTINAPWSGVNPPLVTDGLKQYWWSQYDPLMSLRHLPNAVGADGNQLPPGFQFPAKELVASLNTFRGWKRPLFYCLDSKDIRPLWHTQSNKNLSNH